MAYRQQTPLICQFGSVTINRFIRLKRFIPLRHRWLRGFLYGLFSLILVLGTFGSTGTIASAQSRPSPAPTLPSPWQQLENNLPVLSNFLNSENSQITRGEVWLDGRRLFTIAVPILQEEANQQANGQNQVEPRVQIIESRLRQIVDQGFDEDSLRVTAETDSNSRQPVIYANFTRDGREQTTEILTVTSLDADINGSDLEDWAEEISRSIEKALRTAHQERQPQFLQQQGLWAAGILLGIGLLSLGLSYWQRNLRQERKKLSDQAKTTSTEIAAVTSEMQPPASTTALLQRKTENQQKKRFNDIQWRLSQFGQLLTWGLGFFLIVGLFPQTRWLQPLILNWIQIPVKLLVLVLLIYLAIRLSEMLVDRLFWALQGSTSLATNTSQRLMLRFTTFSQVTKSIAVLVWGIIGLLIAVSMLGIEISPALLTLAGIVGVGISLASQNLIKDVINGFLILLEDQYGVGDVVMIGEVSGFVENMNLRITQLRNAEGHLITVPNSAISVVQNLSKEWSRVDLSVNVAYDADLNQALSVAEQVAQSMTHDPVWQDLILDTPQILGVDNLGDAGATIRLWIKTQPLKQWEVAREYRRRLKLAFDQAGIPIGIPQQSLLLNHPHQLEFSQRPQKS